MSPSAKCAAPCKFRTYGKYRRTAGGKRILNKKFKPEGSCAIEKLRISEDRRCLSYTFWG